MNLMEWNLPWQNNMLSDIGLEVVNDALQIFGGSGYLKGMEVERAYRDMKICTIYEGTMKFSVLLLPLILLEKHLKKHPQRKNQKQLPVSARK